MNTEYYGFTIKCIKAGVFDTQMNLENVMRQLLYSYKADYVEHVMETDSMGRLHIHGTFMAKKSILRSKFKKPYYHIHIDHLKCTDDVANWTAYIHKTDLWYNIRKEIENYAFIDDNKDKINNIDLQ